MSRSSDDLITFSVLGESLCEVGGVDEVGKFREVVSGVGGVRLDEGVVEDLEAASDAAVDLVGEGVQVPPGVSARGSVHETSTAVASSVEVGEDRFGQDEGTEVVDLVDEVESFTGDGARDAGASSVVDEVVDDLLVLRSGSVGVLLERGGNVAHLLEFASGLNDLKSDVLEGVKLGEVHSDVSEGGFGVFLADLIHGGVAHALLLHVEHDDMSTKMSKRAGDEETNVAVGASDDGDAASIGAIGELSLQEVFGGRSVFRKVLGAGAFGDVADESE